MCVRGLYIGFVVHPLRAACMPVPFVPRVTLLPRPAFSSPLQAKATAEADTASAEAARGAWQCKICFSHEVDCAFTGCGHVICSSCARAANTSRCPICRKPSTALLKLFRA